MLIFVYEYITGGGMCREELPSSLAKEGLLMRNAVIRDFSRLRDVEIICPYDSRVSAPEFAEYVPCVTNHDDASKVWMSALNKADAVLIIAPETNGLLSSLVQEAKALGKKILNASPEAISICTKKSATIDFLTKSGVPVLPYYKWPKLPKNTKQWVGKMDDGAGCEDSRVFGELESFNAWIKSRVETHIIQPYQDGISASISMLCLSGKAWVLSCNQQKIVLRNGQFNYEGSVLNALPQYESVCHQIASDIAFAIPELRGYIGVDLILHQDQAFVLEINPRLTTSYVGLHDAMQFNPAKLLLDIAYNDDFVMPKIAHNRIEVLVNAK